MTMLVIGIIFGAGISFVLTGMWAMACYRDALNGLKREMVCQTKNSLKN